MTEKEKTVDLNELFSNIKNNTDISKMEETSIQKPQDIEVNFQEKIKKQLNTKEYLDLYEKVTNNLPKINKAINEFKEKTPLKFSFKDFEIFLYFLMVTSIIFLILRSC